jgi:hypothetical protein
MLSWTLSVVGMGDGNDSVARPVQKTSIDCGTHLGPGDSVVEEKPNRGGATGCDLADAGNGVNGRHGLIVAAIRGCRPRPSTEAKSGGQMVAKSDIWRRDGRQLGARFGGGLGEGEEDLAGDATRFEGRMSRRGIWHGHRPIDDGGEQPRRDPRPHMALHRRADRRLLIDRP